MKSSGRALTTIRSTVPAHQLRPVDGLAFLPAALEIVETPPSPIGRAISLTLIAAFCLALTWASLGHVDLIASAQGMIQRLDTRQLPELAGSLEKTLTSANKLVLSLDNGYGDNTKFNRDLDRLMAQTTDAVRSIRALADLLARHPEALVKGRPAGPLE